MCDLRAFFSFSRRQPKRGPFFHTFSLRVKNTRRTVRAMGGGMTFQDALRTRLEIINPTSAKVSPFYAAWYIPKVTSKLEN